MSRLSISVAYLVKNEAEFLQKSLDSVASFAAEILIGDTGSTDETLEIAEAFKARHPRLQIFSVAWRDDFSQARNEIANRAHEDWILFIDGDEVLDESAAEILKQILETPSAEVYSLIQRNYVREAKYENVSVAENVPGFHEPLFYFENPMERLYRRSSKVLWSGRIHESLFPSLRSLGLRQQTLAIRLHHFGRLKIGQHSKLEKYLVLTQQKLEEDPQNPSAGIEMILTLIELSKTKEAFEFASAFIRRFAQEPEVIKISYQAALRANEFSQAERWIEDYLKFFPDDEFSLSQLTTALLYQNKQEESLQLALQIIEKRPDDFVAHLNAAVVFFERKLWSDALRHLKSAQRLRPHDSFVKTALQKVASMHQNH